MSFIWNFLKERHPEPSPAVAVARALKCQICDEPRNWTLNGTLQTVCYECDRRILIDGMRAANMPVVGSPFDEIKNAIAQLPAHLLEPIRVEVTRQVDDRVTAYKAFHESALRELTEFLSSGRACADCRKTRQGMFLELIARLEGIYAAPADPDGDRYATRAAAYQAGRQYVVLELKTIIQQAIDGIGARQATPAQMP